MNWVFNYLYTVRVALPFYLFRIKFQLYSFPYNNIGKYYLILFEQKSGFHLVSMSLFSRTRIITYYSGV